MTGFEFHKNYLGLPTPDFEKIVVAASVTVFWGGLGRIVISGNPTANGGVVAEDVAATEQIFGLISGIETNDGDQLENADPSKFDGTFTDGGRGVKSYASASDNLTDKMVRVSIRPLTYADVLRATPDGTIGVTTAGSGTRFNYTDIVDSVTVDENNAGNAFTTVAQLMIWGVHPTVTTDGLYVAKELQTEIN